MYAQNSISQILPGRNDPEFRRWELLRIKSFPKIRWYAVLLFVAWVLLGYFTGADMRTGPLLLIAAYVGAYNLIVHRWIAGIDLAKGEQSAAQGPPAAWQAGLDCSGLLLLIYFTGGIDSPVCFFLIIPLLMVTVLFPKRTALLFCGAAWLLVAAMAVLTSGGWLPQQSSVISLPPVTFKESPAQALNRLLLLGIFLFGIALLFIRSRSDFEKKISENAKFIALQANLIQKLQKLFSMIQAIGSSPKLEKVLGVVTAESASVMDVKGISVKLLSEDGKLLRYAAAYGLPETFVREKVIDIEKSPLNKRIIEGESFVTGNVSASEMFQFGEALAEAQIKSILFLPLILEGRVIGTLGAYSTMENRFTGENVNFFRFVADLVAIALENARAYEQVENLVRERSWYMIRLAHNLRAPLAGMLSILEVVKGEYLGSVNPGQQEYLRRLERRCRSLLVMINELMTLAKNREATDLRTDASVSVALLARRVRRTFQDRAAEKELTFSVISPSNLPPIRGELEIVEQILENLISNAIKYTPADGSVEVTFSRADSMVRIEVRDNGIGIPDSEKPKLFTDFFRAANARAAEKVGTGLGLAIVKESTQILGGRIVVESEEGMGTLFVVHLPIAAHAAGGQNASGTTH